MAVPAHAVIPAQAVIPAYAGIAGVVRCLRAAPAEPALTAARALLDRLETETWSPDDVSPLIEQIERVAQTLQSATAGQPTCLMRLKALPPIGDGGTPTGF